MKKNMFRLVLSVATLGFLLVFIAGESTSASLYGRGIYGACGYSESCTISLATSGEVELDVVPTTGGAITIDRDIVEVTTNNPFGFKLAVETESAEENGLVGSDATIPASSGTAVSPVVLSGTQWGIRIDQQEGFGLGPTEEVSNQPSSSLTFAGVPTYGNPLSVVTYGIPAPDGVATSVWYGVRADSSVPSGAYTATVVYTAVVVQ